MLENLKRDKSILKNKIDWSKHIKKYESPTIPKALLLKPFFLSQKFKGKVLDAGCGNGYFTKLLALKNKIVGVDVHDLKSPDFEYIKSNLKSTLFNRGFFSNILLINVLSCVDQKEREEIIKELKRVKAKNGLIYCVNTSEQLIRKNISNKIFISKKISLNKVHLKILKTDGEYVEFDDYVVSGEEMTSLLKQNNLKLVGRKEFYLDGIDVPIYVLSILK